MHRGCVAGVSDCFGRVLSRGSLPGASHPRPVWGPPDSLLGAIPAPPAPRGDCSTLSSVHRMLALALCLLAIALVAPSPSFAQQGDANAGKVLYERKCAGCHGVKGDGKGPAAELLRPAPRDFTSGIYKIRSTVNKIPTDKDIFEVLTYGMPGTSMPPWSVLPEKDRWNLVAYVKTFAADKFKEAP